MIGRAGEYPFVVCTNHPGLPAPGYAVCPHVGEEGATPAFVTPADPTDLGDILCAACISEVEARGSDALPDPLIFCASCVRDAGWLDVPGVSLQ